MAAAALGARRGFDAISMADIGAEAGIVGSGVYRHFDSKTAILVAMADRVMDRLMMMLPGPAITPAEIGQSIVYLASPAARMITGCVLAFDGGMS